MVKGEIFARGALGCHSAKPTGALACRDLRSAPLHRCPEGVGGALTAMPANEGLLTSSQLAR
jgi:hypothetical protein